MYQASSWSTAAWTDLEVCSRDATVGGRRESGHWVRTCASTAAGSVSIRSGKTERYGARGRDQAVPRARLPKVEVNVIKVFRTLRHVILNKVYDVAPLLPPVHDDFL